MRKSTNEMKKRAEDLEDEELLNTPLDELADPGLVPDGTWRLLCTYAAVQNPRPEDHFRYAIVLLHTPVKAVAVEDGEDVENGGWRGARIRTMFRFVNTQDKAYIKQIFEAHGVSTESRSPGVLCEVVRGRFVNALVGTKSWERNTDDGKETVVENKLSRFRPAEAEDEDAAA